MIFMGFALIAVDTRRRDWLFPEMPKRRSHEIGLTSNVCDSDARGFAAIDPGLKLSQLDFAEFNPLVYASIILDWD